MPTSRFDLTRRRACTARGRVFDLKGAPRPGRGGEDRGHGLPCSPMQSRLRRYIPAGEGNEAPGEKKRKDSGELPFVAVGAWGIGESKTFRSVPPMGRAGRCNIGIGKHAIGESEKQACGVWRQFPWGVGGGRGGTGPGPGRHRGQVVGGHWGRKPPECPPVPGGDCANSHTVDPSCL